MVPLLHENVETGARVALASEAKVRANAPPKRRYAQLRLLIIAALAVFLVWQIFTNGVAAYLAENDPEGALWLQPRQPTALTKLADERLNPKPFLTDDPDAQKANMDTGFLTDQAAVNEGASLEGFAGSVDLAEQDLVQIKAWAKLALQDNPLNARALRILGQVASREQDEKRADALMQAAADRSLHETYAVYWTMAKNYHAGDYSAALRYADILLRTRNQVQSYVMPMVAKLTEVPEASHKVKELLAKNPPWRSEFLAYLPGGISDARTPLDVLLSLKNSSAPPAQSDLVPYLSFLIQHKFHELAYYTWLQFLPPEQLSKVGRLFNGNFQTVPSGAPFDWVFSGRQGVTIQLSERADQTGDNALLIEFGPGRVDFGGVTQIVLLPAGDYHLTGKYKSELVSQRGLLWRVNCGDKSLGESFPVRSSDPAWKDFGIVFTVPENCAVQQVKLVLDARSASETFVSGSIWYDNLRITRDEETTPIPAE